MPSSLHAIWQQNVARSPDSIAVTDAKSGEKFTFAQLDQEDSSTSTQFPTGNGILFIRQTIAAWKKNLPTCPLEDNTTPPDLTGIPDGTAHLKVTSGSTGTPRLVAFTAEQLAADARNIVATMGLVPEQPNIGVISLAHSYGFSNLVLPLLLHRIPLILGGDPLPESFSRALTFLPENGGTVPAVPAMWRAWFKSGCLDKKKIKTAISAGAPLTSRLESAIYKETGIKIHNFYGSSECGGIAYDRTITPRKDQNSAGTPMSGVVTDLTPDGCLVVIGAAVATTYWPEPDPETLAEQQFVTSDLAEIAPDGTIILKGRAGDLINIAGRKLDPSSIERELRQHPAVDHAVVFGIPSPDPERVQEIVAITNAGTPDELKHHLAERLPSWQKVSHWWTTPDLAPDQRGKLSRKKWHDRWQQSKKS